MLKLKNVPGHVRACRCRYFSCSLASPAPSSLMRTKGLGSPARTMSPGQETFLGWYPVADERYSYDFVGGAHVGRVKITTKFPGLVSGSRMKRTRIPNQPAWSEHTRGKERRVIMYYVRAHIKKGVARQNRSKLRCYRSSSAVHTTIYS